MPAFNPYREWLGISNPRKLTYYQVLGVTRQDTPEVIRQRALQIIKKLNGLDVEQREEERQRLIRNIKQAAVCLMDPERRATYDQKIAQQPQAAPKPKKHKNTQSSPAAKPTSTSEQSTRRQEPQPVQTSSTEPSSKTEQSKTEPRPAPAPARAPAAASVAPSGGEDSKSSDSSDVRYHPGKTVTNELMRLRPRQRTIAPAYKARQKRSKAFLFSSALAVLSLLGIGYLVFTQTNFGKSLVASSVINANSTDNRSSTNQQPLPFERPNPTVAEKQTPPFETQREPVGIGESDPGGQPNATMPEVSRNSATTSHVATHISAPLDPSANPELYRILSDTRTALSRRNTKKAAELLDRARSFVSQPEEKAMLARLVTLAEYVTTYWEATGDQLQKFQSGNEVVINGQRVMVVEKTKDRLTLRSRGRNKTFDLNDLPIPFAVQLADSWLDPDSASTKVFRGAMMAITEGYDKEDARRLWKEAQADGELNLGDLELVLDEDYATATE